MNDKLKFSILRICSRHFLSNPLLNNWNQLTQNQQHRFLNEHGLPSFKQHKAEDLCSCIQSCVRTTTKIVEAISERFVKNEEVIYISWSVDNVRQRATERNIKLSNSECLFILESDLK